MQVVCFKCVLTKHKEHAMQDLVDTAREAEGQLLGHKARLELLIDRVLNHTERQRLEQHDLEAKMAAVKRNLQNRHDTIVAAARKYVEEAVDSMDKVWVALVAVAAWFKQHLIN